jgi:hypothetical protein
VDRAGNRAGLRATVHVDRTAPEVVPAVRDADRGQWWSAPVDVSFRCTDAVSGVAHCPAPVTVGEGADQVVSATARDVAGNEAAASRPGLQVDLTAPVLTGTAEPAPASGWYRSDVTVTWDCRDPLSGVDGGCPEPTVLTGEGDLAAAATVQDRAGHRTTATVDGIRVDRTSPVTAAELPVEPESGWYAGRVPVVLTATDALSGVARTTVSVDGGPAQTYDGPVVVEGDGVHTVRFWSTDEAGNTEQSRTVTLLVDGVAPASSVRTSSEPGATGWHAGPVSVLLAATDAGSGVAETQVALGDGAARPVTGSLLVEGDGVHVLRFWSTDGAGNVEPARTLEVRIDGTLPVTTPSAPAVPASGWYAGPVDVTLAAADATSGVVSTTVVVDGAPARAYTGPVRVSGDGRHTVRFWSTDAAGNVEESTTLALAIDATAPQLALTGPQDGRTYLLGEAVPAVSCSASDAGSVPDPASLAEQLTGRHRLAEQVVRPSCGPVSASCGAVASIARASVVDSSTLPAASVLQNRTVCRPSPLTRTTGVGPGGRAVDHDRRADDAGRGVAAARVTSTGPAYHRRPARRCRRGGDGQGAVDPHLEGPRRLDVAGAVGAPEPQHVHAVALDQQRAGHRRAAPSPSATCVSATPEPASVAARSTDTGPACQPVAPGSELVRTELAGRPRRPAA